MKAYIILGNTRVKSNTEALAKIFAGELAAAGVDVARVALREKNVQTCVGCDICHGVLDTFGCVIDDDMQEIAKEILASDLVVFASPIYTWMPTPPMKAVMDRIYAFTKYPVNAGAFNLLKKQKFAVLATSGDVCEENCDLFDESVRRMANFAKIPYMGYLAAKDHGDGNMERQEVIDDARKFTQKCVNPLYFKAIPESDYEKLYRHMQKDFPLPGELAPFHAIKRNLESGKYQGFYLHDTDEVGYMVVTAPENTRLVFGNYFAVYSEFRSKGLGTSFLDAILDKYRDRSFVIEVSDPAAAESAELRIEAEKRIKFYERAGFVVAPTAKAKIFGADMKIMVTNIYDGFSAREAMLALYTPSLGSSGHLINNIDVIDA
jgi:multimeric flavodoxin WrbA